MDQSRLPAKLMERMEKMNVGRELQIPPPVFLEMEGEILDFDDAKKSLTVRFPVRERYQNPMGYMQGGMIATAVDNVVGPLSFLVAPPSVTKTLEMSYRRPIPPSIGEIIVTAWLAGREEGELIFEAVVRRGEDTTLATATLRNVILRQRGR